MTCQVCQAATCLPCFSSRDVAINPFHQCGVAAKVPLSSARRSVRPSAMLREYRIAARQQRALPVPQDAIDHHQHEHQLNFQGNLGPNMVANKNAAQGEAFAGFYGGQHAGRDVRDNLGPGMVPNAAAARGELGHARERPRARPVLHAPSDPPSPPAAPHR